jgi:hypothetical protein
VEEQQYNIIKLKLEGPVEKYHSVVQFDVRLIAIAIRRRIGHSYRPVHIYMAIYGPGPGPGPDQQCCNAACRIGPWSIYSK